MNGHDHEPKDLRMFEHISKSICELAHELCEGRKQRAIEFDWLRSHFGLATKHDLKDMETRLTDAIKASANIAPAVEAAAKRLGSKIDKLDNSIPDKQTETKSI